MSRFLAIDLDPQGLFVAAGTAKAGAARVEQTVAWVPGTDHGPPALSADTAKQLGEALRDRLKAAKVAPAPALVCVGRDRVIFREVEFPPVPPAEEPAVVRFQVLKELPENPDDLVLDYALLPEPGADGQRRATVVVIRKDVFAAVQAVCAAAGLKLAGVTPRPFAVAAGLAAAVAAGDVEAPPAGEAVAAVTLGPGGGEFTVVRGREVAFTRTIPGPVASNDVLLAAELKRNVAVYQGTSAIGTVYLAEPAGRLGGWASRLKRAGFAGKLKSYDPLATSPADVPDELRGRFAGAAGLLAAKAADAVPINFAAPRQPRAVADPKKKLLIAAGVAAGLLFLVGGAAGYVVLSTAEEQLARLQAEKADLEKELADRGPDRERLKAADQWQAREVNYLDELYDLSDRVPPGDQLRVTKIESAASRIDKGGKQDAQAQLKVFMGAKTPDAASALLSAFNNDNTAAKKYYVGAQNSTVGTATGSTAYPRLFTLVTKVNHRDPKDYTRSAAFVTPPRRAAAPPASEDEEGP